MTCERSRNEWDDLWLQFDKTKNLEFKTVPGISPKSPQTINPFTKEHITKISSIIDPQEYAIVDSNNRYAVLGQEDVHEVVVAPVPKTASLQPIKPLRGCKCGQEQKVV